MRKFGMALLLALACFVAVDGNAGEKTIGLSYGFQDAALAQHRAREASFPAIFEKYRVLMLLDGTSMNLSPARPEDRQAFITTVEGYTPASRRDCADAGIADMTTYASFCLMRDLWRDARDRYDRTLPETAAGTSWRAMVDWQQNPILAERMATLFLEDLAAGVSLTTLHGYGLVHDAVKLFLHLERADEITPEWAVYFLMRDRTRRSAELGEFNSLNKARPDIAYAALAATFEVSAVEEVLWRQRDKTPVEIYFDGLSSGAITFAEAMTTLDALEARTRLARADFEKRGRKPYVEFCDRWLDENFGKLRTALTAIFGE